MGSKLVESRRVEPHEDEEQSNRELARYYLESVALTSRGRQVLILVFVLMTYADQHAMMYGTEFSAFALPFVELTTREIMLAFGMVMGPILAGSILYAMDLWREEIGTVIDDERGNLVMKPAFSAVSIVVIISAMVVASEVAVRFGVHPVVVGLALLGAFVLMMRVVAVWGDPQ